MWNKKHIENIKICALADLREGRKQNVIDSIKKYELLEDYQICQGLKEALKEFEQGILKK